MAKVALVLALFIAICQILTIVVFTRMVKNLEEYTVDTFAHLGQHMRENEKTIARDVAGVQMQTHKNNQLISDLMRENEKLKHFCYRWFPTEALDELDEEGDKDA